MAGEETAKQVHAKLLLFLNDNIPKASTIYKNLCIASEAYLTPQDTLECESVSDIVSKLIHKGKCSVGNYEILRSLVYQVTKDATILAFIDDAQQKESASVGRATRGRETKFDPDDSLAAPVTDTLSRTYDPAINTTSLFGQEHTSIKHLPITYETLQKIKNETEKDEVLQNRIHADYLCLECRPRDLLYRPGLYSEIQAFKVGQKHIGSHDQEPMRPHRISEEPWERLAYDLLDYCSHYFKGTALSNKKAAVLICDMKPIFARHGMCDELVTDNCQHFNNKFCTPVTTAGFKQIATTHDYTQTNKPTKRYFQCENKSHKIKQYPNRVLSSIQHHQITDLASTEQLHMGRICETIFPTQPILPSSKRQSLNNKQEYYGSPTLKSIKEERTVMEKRIASTPYEPLIINMPLTPQQSPTIRLVPSTDMASVQYYPDNHPTTSNDDGSNADNHPTTSNSDGHAQFLRPKCKVNFTKFEDSVSSKY